MKRALSDCTPRFRIACLKFRSRAVFADRFYFPRGVFASRLCSCQCAHCLLLSMFLLLLRQVSLSRKERARHGAGHGLADVWALRSGDMRRAPDAVVWPNSEDQASRSYTPPPRPPCLSVFRSSAPPPLPPPQHLPSTPPPVEYTRRNGMRWR